MSIHIVPLNNHVRKIIVHAEVLRSIQLEVSAAAGDVKNERESNKRTGADSGRAGGVPCNLTYVSRTYFTNFYKEIHFIRMMMTLLLCCHDENRRLRLPLNSYSFNKSLYIILNQI